MFSADQIKEQTYFTEQYFDSEIMMQDLQKGRML